MNLATVDEIQAIVERLSREGYRRIGVAGFVILSLFMLPAEMHIRSGGFRAVLPRKIAREAVNDLLRQVGAQQIP